LYFIAIINYKSIEAEGSNRRKLTSKQFSSMDQTIHSISVTDTLYDLFDKAIQAEFSDVPEASVIIATSKVADYQCNSAMAISQVNCLFFCFFLFYFFT
jgi:hypothetical protein